MSSILDHVEQAVPRATVYGAMRGSPVFIGKNYVEIRPASNATTYQWSTGERTISFVVASPDKTAFYDMRSIYLKLNILDITADNNETDHAKISEPGSNFIERIVIKMNGTVVEDISRFDHLTSFFKRKLLTREQKNARQREGWDYVGPSQAADVADTAVFGAADTTPNSNGETVSAAINAGINAATTAGRGIQPFNQTGNQDLFTTVETNITNGSVGSNNICVKLDLSGIMNIHELSNQEPKIMYRTSSDEP